jgi:serine protease AprX
MRLNSAARRAFSSIAPADGYGHGTQVAGLINGHDSAAKYLGIAANATLISVKIADDNGNARESDLLRGLGWLYLTCRRYRIRALNLSVSVSVPQSYATSPSMRWSNDCGTRA